MIIRIVRIKVQPGMQEEYGQFLRSGAIPKLQAQAGLLGLFIGPRYGSQPTEQFVIVLLWQDLAALQAFVGPALEEAVVLPGEAHMVAEVNVENYESLDATGWDYAHAMGAS
jgi:heme-degrading monooxygenase HmoA